MSKTINNLVCLVLINLWWFSFHRWHAYKHNWCKWRLSWLIKTLWIQGTWRINGRGMWMESQTFRVTRVTWTLFLLRARWIPLTTAAVILWIICRRHITAAERSFHSKVVPWREHITVLTWVSFKHWPSEWWGTDQIPCSRLRTWWWIYLWSNSDVLYAPMMYILSLPFCLFEEKQISTTNPKV